MKKRNADKRRPAMNVAETQTARRWTWRKRLAVMALMVSGLLVGAWATGGLAAGLFFYTDYQLMVRNNLKALRWAETARYLNGDRAHIEFIRARVNRRLSDLEAMDFHLRAAQRYGLPHEQVEKERALALAQSGRLGEVIQSLQEWVKEPGDDVADIADAYSQGLEAMGRPYETKVVLAAWAADCPNDPKPHVQLARIAEMELRDDDAETLYQTALEKNPQYPAALYAYSQLLLKRKRPQEALPLLARCASIDPVTKPAVEITMAASERLLGDRESARKRLEQVLDLPQSEIEQGYRRLALAPEDGAAAFEMGNLEFDDQRFVEAAEYYRQAMKQAPDHFDAERQLGLTLKRLGREQEAEETLARVAKKREELAVIAPLYSRIHAKPDDFEARYQIGSLLLDNGRIERGLFYLNGVLVDAPQHRPTHRRLVEFYRSNRELNLSYAELADHHQQILDSLDRTKE